VCFSTKVCQEKQRHLARRGGSERVANKVVLLTCQRLHNRNPLESSTLSVEFAKFQKTLDAYVEEKMAA